MEDHSRQRMGEAVQRWLSDQRCFDDIPDGVALAGALDTEHGHDVRAVDVERGRLTTAGDATDDSELFAFIRHADEQDVFKFRPLTRGPLVRGPYRQFVVDFDLALDRFIEVLIAVDDAWNLLPLL